MNSTLARQPLLSLERLEDRDVPSTTVTVNGTSNIYGAGLTTPPNPGGGGGGTLPVAIALSKLGDPARIEFPAATGTVSGFVGSGSFNGPDGGNFFGGKTLVPAHKGISGIRNDNGVMFLAGVFIGESGQPATAPPRLDFTNANTTTTFTPVLGQQFFIGNGKTNKGVLQNTIVPPGASKLYLGFAEGFGFGSNNQPGFYGDNGGALTVTVDAAPYTTTITGGVNQQIDFAPTAQTISLSATVTSEVGPVTAGSVSFGLFNGTTLVGTATPGAVVNGTATVTYTIPAGTAPGTYTVQATYGGTATFGAAGATPVGTVTIVPGPVSQLVVQAGGGQSAPVGAEFGQIITVLVLDQFGNSLAGPTITVSGPTTGAGATFTSPAITNAQGLTTFTATANSIAGTYTVTVTVAGVTQTFTLTNVSGPVTSVTISGGGQTVPAGGTFGAITATAIDL
ncbi:MAG: hypothetical protein ACRCZF_26020, partial [Gemmataceae bacterium]